MRQTLLSNDQLLFLQDEKRLLADISLKLRRFGLPKEAEDTLQKAINQLDELFLIVVVGEFNAGKSALINALLGERVLTEGVTPTTMRVTLVRWGENSAHMIVDDGFAIQSHPLPLLKELNIVDSPGTNAIIRHHERLTNEYVPRSDLVLFTTSADRPMTDSERQFLEKILSWGKKVTVIINKSDILEDETAVEEVRAFVLNHSAEILGETPELFITSARLAQKANETGDPQEKSRLRAMSGIDTLENYISETLDDKKRLELKFRNPLGVAANLHLQAHAHNQHQAQEIAEDYQLVETLERTISTHEKELQGEVPPRLAEVENILQHFEMRGQDFFDNTMRLLNIGNLAKSEKIKVKFEQEVLSNVPQEIDEKVRALIDWLVDKDLKVWYQVMAALEHRQASSQNQFAGELVSPQTARRKELIDSVGSTIKTIVNSYNRKKEADELSAFVEGAVTQTALFGVGAVGLGALVASALFSSAMDVTGIVAAGTLAILGLFVIPYRRKQAKQNFKEKMEELRGSLMSTLTHSFTSEFEMAIRRLREKIAPYTSEVHADQERISADADTLNEIETLIKETQNRIETVL